MADKEKIMLWAKAHSNRLFLGGMAALLVVRLYLSSSPFTPPPVPDIAAEPLVPTITTGSLEYQKVRSLIEPRKNFDVSTYTMLAQYNMFDPKIAQSAPQITAEANQLYNSAKQSYDLGVQAEQASDMAKARTLYAAAAANLKQALDRQPNHVLAQKLRGDVEAKLQGLQAGGNPAAAAPGAPAAGAAPVATPQP